MAGLQETDEKIIKAIYVFSKEGNCLVKYTALPEGQMSLTIMNTLENSVQSLKIPTPFESGESSTSEIARVYHKSKQGITFAMICSTKLPKEAVSHLLDNISRKFMNIYSGRLTTQNGNAETYEGFQQILEGCCYPPYVKILMKEFGH
ncbi:MAG: hypothetical protein ACFFBS_02050 [Promethearchaeota archaeon]